MQRMCDVLFGRSRFGMFCRIAKHKTIQKSCPSRSGFNIRVGRYYTSKLNINHDEFPTQQLLKHKASEEDHEIKLY